MSTAGGGIKLNQSVLKAIALLRAAADDHNASVSSLARASGLPRPTALRLIQTLEHEGFVLRNPGDERVLLGPELYRLARGGDTEAMLVEVARQVLAGLVKDVRETVTLSVVAPDGGLDLIEQLDAPHQLRPGSWVGQRFPLHCSATGKLLLATMDEAQLRATLREPLRRYTPATITDLPTLRRELETVRTQQCAIASDEEEEGLTGVAAGIYDAGGTLLGAVTIAGPTQRIDLSEGSAAIAATLRAAGRIEATLRGR